MATLKCMGRPAPELPADTLISAVDNAGRGVVTHITIKGDRVAAIISRSTLAMSRLLAALLTSETAASARERDQLAQHANPVGGTAHGQAPRWPVAGQSLTTGRKRPV